MTLTNEDLQALALLIDDVLDKKFNEKLSPINKRLDNLEHRLDTLEHRMDNLERRIEKLEAEVSALKDGQIALKKEMQELKDKVSATYDLALEAWGQSTENRRWLEAKSQEAIG